MNILNKQNIPRVIIKKKEAKKTMESWLGKTSSQQETPIKFGILLQQAGIPNTETCILERSKENNMQFNCHLKKQRKNISISLILEDVDNFGELIITTETERKTFEYHKETRAEGMKLVLRKEEKTPSTYIPEQRKDSIIPYGKQPQKKGMVKQKKLKTGQN